ncbi:MAG: SDR family oxidoreductase [Thermohalobaculum sp.]|nr:SDR family oxidoreductase [Thermohalobaculum sp.]
MSGVALVTGASSGIGAATVRALAGAGWQVHALARRADRLAVLAAETGAVPHAIDIADTVALERLAGSVGPDLLVNNAGLGAGIAGLATATADDIARTIGVNVAALLQVLRVFLPGMRARGRGHVVNLGSVAGLYPNQSAIYGASKGAVRQLSRNLRLELRGTGIRVTEIQPGRVATEFYDAAIPDDPATRDRFKRTPIRELAPGDVAAAILYAVSAPPHVNVSAIELQPTDQTFGGVFFDPVEG